MITSIQHKIPGRSRKRAAQTFKSIHALNHNSKKEYFLCVCVSEREREVEIESKMLHNTSNTKQIKIIQFAGQRENSKQQLEEG